MWLRLACWIRCIRDYAGIFLSLTNSFMSLNIVLFTNISNFNYRPMEELVPDGNNLIFRGKHCSEGFVGSFIHCYLRDFWNPFISSVLQMNPVDLVWSSQATPALFGSWFWWSPPIWSGLLCAMLLVTQGQCLHQGPWRGNKNPNLSCSATQPRSVGSSISRAKDSLDYFSLAQEIQRESQRVGLRELWELLDRQTDRFERLFFVLWFKRK